MASGAAKNRMLEQKRLFHARMTPSQSLMVTDGALKLNYTSVIFVDPGVQIDETELSSLTAVVVCRTQVSGSLHLSKTMAQRTQNASLQHSCFTR